MNSVSMWSSDERVTTKVTTSLEGHFEVVMVNSLPKNVIGGLLLLDVDFLGERAFEFCKEIKYSLPTTDFLVILLTDGDPAKIVSGFAAGASEIINYNSSPLEIAARVSACWKRHHLNQQSRLVFCNGRVELDVIRHTISCKFAGQESLTAVEVTPHEFHLFFQLISADSKIIPRKKLLNAVWGEKVNVLARTVDRHISSLREKTRGIGKIESVRGRGYVFKMEKECLQGEYLDEKQNLAR